MSTQEFSLAASSSGNNLRSDLPPSPSKNGGQVDPPAEMHGRVVKKEVYTLALKQKDTADKIRTGSPNPMPPGRSFSESPSRGSPTESPHVSANTSSGSPKTSVSTPKDIPKPPTPKDSPKSHSPKTGSPLGSDSPSDSPTRPRRRSGTNLMANFRNSLPRSLMGSQIASALLKLPEQNDAAWANKEEYSDNFIMKLPPAEFARVPFFRIIEMPPEILSEAESNQIRCLKTSEVAEILLRHGPQLESSFFDLLDSKELAKLDSRTKMTIFFRDSVYPKIGPALKAMLSFERVVYEYEQSILNMNKDDILTIDFKYLNIISIDVLVKLDNGCRRVIIDRHWKELSRPKIKALSASFSEHDWSLLSPDCINEFMKYREPDEPVPFPKEFWVKMNERIRCREMIRDKLKRYLNGTPLKPEDKLDFANTFMSFFSGPQMNRFRMKPELFSEAATMAEFDILREITNFETLASHICVSLLSKPFPVFKATEILEQIDPIGKVERVYNPQKKARTSSDLLSSNCRIIIGSLYPCLARPPETNKRRVGDPIEDDMFFQKIAGENGGCCLTFGAARGIKPVHERGTFAANRKFIEAIDHSLKTGVSNIHHLLRLMVLAHQKSFLAQPETEISHSGLVALKVPGENIFSWEVVVVSVGDHKIFHYNRSTKQCIDVTKGNLNHVTQPEDAGGRLGIYANNRAAHTLAYPDLRNYCVGSITAGEGDIFITVSRGVHLQMDPQNHGLSPLQACKILLEGKPQTISDLLQSEVNENDLQAWTRSPDCRRIKELYIEMTAGNLVEKSLHKQENVACTIAKHCRKATHDMRIWMTQHPTESCPNVGETKEIKVKGKHQQAIMLGRLDHYSVAAIELKS